MHQSSFSIVSEFRKLVERHFQQGPVRLLDVGSYGVNGTYKEIFADTAMYLYTGLDVNPGPNVDYVPADPYAWPELGAESFDLIISGQAFEHIEFPWLVIDEMRRVLKKNGLICIVAPSRGPEHKYPVDCWRYYPDGFRALAKWAGLQVLEAKTYWGASGFSDGSDQWGDTFCILYKPFADQPRRQVRPGRRMISREHSGNPLRSGKQAAYYGFARTEVVDAIVRSGLTPGRVLEIGCAGGATGRSLKEKAAVSSYVGIELSPEAAEQARKHLDNVIVADIERTDLAQDHGLKHAEFDTVIALDVLEHLYDPWDSLRELTEFLKPGGHVVLSIPNVQNIVVVQGLIGGQWKYETAGILDATHLRFFTLEGAKQLIGGAGLTVRSIDKVLNPPLDLSQIKETGNRYKQGNLEIADLTKEQLADLFTYQFIVIAQKQRTSEKSDAQGANPASNEAAATAPVQATLAHQPVAGLTSLVILTLNQLEYTKKCVKSIRKHTPETHEIIFVDNGSTDGTVKWLEKQMREHDNYRLIRNEKNLGFAKGCNQGIEASKGEYILLLNNDVIVTKDWLGGLLECLNSSSDTGIIGPMTNNISGPQRVDGDTYRSIDYLDAYAAKFRGQNRHRRIPLRRIVGFCMLFRRSLAEQIGLLDESFGTGNYEDDDLCLRAALEGYRNLIAGDVFIHHFGSASFKGNRIDYGQAMTGNRKIFDAKWRKIDAYSDLGRKTAVLNAVEAGTSLYQAGSVDKAITALIDGLKYFPDSAAICYRLAELLTDAKLFKDAVEALDAVQEHEKGSSRYLVSRAYCMEGLDQLDEAEGLAASALAIEPESAAAMNLRGMIAYKRAGRGAAAAYFEKAVQTDPGYGEPYTNLGVLFWASGEHEKALDFLEKGARLSLDQTDTLSLYHGAITATAQFGRGERLFRDLKHFFPSHRRIRLSLIDMLVQQNSREAAMDELQETVISFGCDDELLAAGLAVRGHLGPKTISGDAAESGSLSVCMIVKNEEEYLARCLGSVQPVADEVIVVDTGSTDRTKQIAAMFGAQVSDFAWTGDFSAARNRSLALASGDWILVLDGDEVISQRDCGEIRRIVRDTRKDHAAGYTLVTRNYVTNVGSLGWVANRGAYPDEEAGTGWFPSPKVRLFPNDPRIRFKGHVHELVEESVRQAGLTIRTAQIVVHHYGKLKEDKVRVKGEHYYLIGKRKLDENPDDINAVSELATQAQELGLYDDAVELWNRAIRLSADEPRAYDCFQLGCCYLHTGAYRKSMEASKKALERAPAMKEALINFLNAELIIGDEASVIKSLEGAAGLVREYPPAAVLLASAYSLCGREADARKAFGELVGQGYLIAESQNVLSRDMLRAGRVDRSLRILRTIIDSGYGNDESRQLFKESRSLMQAPDSTDNRMP